MAGTCALVVTHGKLGRQLVRVVEMIVGPVAGLTSLSNEEFSALELAAEIRRWLAECDADDPTGRLVLVDDYGGSCATAAQLACEDEGTAIISGVNLAMLLAFASWREDYELEELVQQLIRKGRDAIIRVGGKRAGRTCRTSARPGSVNRAMDIVLARIDDRFIHGQVTVGWSQKLRPDRIVLANDAIAADPWQCRVYGSTVPPEITVAILDLETTAAAMRETNGEFAAGRTILLTGSPADLYALHRKGRTLPEINVGGMHYSPGKQEMLPFVYVDPDDLVVLRAFLATGCLMTAQQVPGGKAIVVGENLIESMEGRL